MMSCSVGTMWPSLAVLARHQSPGIRSLWAFHANLFISTFLYPAEARSFNVATILHVTSSAVCPPLDWLWTQSLTGSDQRLFKCIPAWSQYLGLELWGGDHPMLPVRSTAADHRSRRRWWVKCGDKLRLLQDCDIQLDLKWIVTFSGLVC